MNNYALAKTLIGRVKSANDYIGNKRKIEKRRIYEDIAEGMLWELPNVHKVRSQYEHGASKFDSVALDKDGNIIAVVEAKTRLQIQDIAKFAMQTAELDCIKLIICGSDGVSKNNNIRLMSNGMGIRIFNLFSEYSWNDAKWVAERYSETVDFLRAA